MGPEWEGSRMSSPRLKPWNHSKVRVSPAAALTKVGTGLPPLTLQTRSGEARSLMGSVLSGERMYLFWPSPWSAPLTKTANIIVWAVVVVAKRAPAKARAVGRCIAGIWSGSAVWSGLRALLCVATDLL